MPCSWSVQQQTKSHDVCSVVEIADKRDKAGVKVLDWIDARPALRQYPPCSGEGCDAVPPELDPEDVDLAASAEE